MDNLLAGLRRYTEKIYPKQKEMFDGLARGQKPHTLFVTCSDSRIDPNLITQTNPGELFVLRNPGNMVPTFGSSGGGEEAAVEFAVRFLGVRNIVVCGHSKCGAVGAMLDSRPLAELPATRTWLNHAADTKQKMARGDSPGDVRVCTEMNVLAQIENLRSHPSVSERLSEGTLDIFGWIYHFERGTVSVYHGGQGRFVPFTEITDSQLAGQLKN